MAFAKKSHLFGALVLALALPGISLGEVKGNCNQDPDHAPEKGKGTGSISVITTPEKAVVFLNGDRLGLSPVDTAYQAGRFNFTIMLNGEELVKERINICPGEKTTWEGDLKMPYGSVALKTNPLNVNAVVYVDGEQVGSTKGGVLTINRLEAGTRVFKVVAKGKKAKEVSVNVLPEETVDLNVDLKR